MTAPPSFTLSPRIFEALERGLEEWGYVLDQNSGEYDEETLDSLKRGFEEAWEWLHPKRAA